MLVCYDIDNIASINQQPGICQPRNWFLRPRVSQNRLRSLNYKVTSIQRPPCLKPTQPTERSPVCKPSGVPLPALPLLKQVKTSRSLSRSCKTEASCAFSTSSWQLEVLSLAAQGLRHPIFHRCIVSHHPLLNGSDVVGFVHFPGAVVHWLPARLHGHHIRK